MESMNKIQLTTALISLGKFSYMSFSTPYYKNKCIFELCNFRLHSFIYFLKGSPEMKKVAIVMGSDSDLPIVKKAAQVLKDFGVPTELRVLSAHRCAAEVSEFARNAEKNGTGVIIAAAGKAAHLAGAIAGQTPLPVIGIPIKASALEGIDALLSTVQMPAGVPVATVAIDGAANAAFLAVQILAVSDDALMDKMKAYRAAQTAKVLEADKKMEQVLAEL